MDRNLIVQIKCPVCKRRLLDANKGTHSAVSLASEYNGNADYYTKCWHCGNIIGIRKIG